MTTPWTLTFDGHDARGQAEFWKVALVMSTARLDGLRPLS